MSRYSTIAETFDFKQRSILNGTRKIRSGVTPGSAQIEKCIYRYVQSTRDTRSACTQPTLFSHLTLVLVSMRAHLSVSLRGEEEEGESAWGGCTRCVSAAQPLRVMQH